MSRKKGTIKKRLIADRMYGNVLIGKLINRIMRDGKKSVVERQGYHAFDIIREKHEDPVAVLQEAVKNISPQMEVRSRRIGGAAYQVPVQVRGNRRTALALQWLIMEARKRSNKDFHTFADKLAAEILEAFANEGGAVKRRELAHKMAESNRAFSHFRW